ncbi:alkylation response protein AidB-like acyl-CoA dehydrogenase [Allocatelliglobosispora scoriae]|uniref:Alkylation response protein AidB-like acyl-CoA dehydrogenase n=1 Tax=Allocatelliglobosispora scoriae TaxID=643052 RepID=A0A841C0M8_9ACTN|nr:acyl-CoA dehydrogenase family protein [Allocatelliglobosispora scoriae]MBB5873485.1 alkylation response protein AidB-like acyl-CoA dehydrogenase [Allocatelliglobosispora scoriae]
MTSQILDARDVETVFDRASARRFVDAHIAPYANGFEFEGRIPEELIEKMSAAGIWAPFLPVELGGIGMDMVTLGEIHEEVGRGCSSVRSLLTVHTMAAWTVLRWGTPTQREEWGRALASGEALGAFCLTEPEAGSDAAAIQTSATPSHGGWVINGVKKWITNGQRADVYLVFARVNGTIGAFLVPRRTPGVHVRPIPEILGTRASMLAEVTFSDVPLGPSALLGPASGFAAGMVLTGTLDLGRYSVATGSVGIIQACLDACAAYTSRRTVGGSPLRSLQLIQAKMSDMVTDVRAARMLVAEAGRLKDKGDPSTIMATWIAKYFASTAAAVHASEAVQIHGANGCGPEYPVARYYRDAKVMEIIEGSNEIQRITIAAEAYRELNQ